MILGIPLPSQAETYSPATLAVPTKCTRASNPSSANYPSSSSSSYPAPICIYSTRYSNFPPLHKPAATTPSESDSTTLYQAEWRIPLRAWIRIIHFSISYQFAPHRSSNTPCSALGSTHRATSSCDREPENGCYPRKICVLGRRVLGNVQIIRWANYLTSYNL